MGCCALHLISYTMEKWSGLGGARGWPGGRATNPRNMKVRMSMAVKKQDDIRFSLLLQAYNTNNCYTGINYSHFEMN